MYTTEFPLLLHYYMYQVVRGERCVVINESRCNGIGSDAANRTATRHMQRHKNLPAGTFYMQLLIYSHYLFARFAKNMASFLSRAASNTQFQLATTAVVSGAVVAGTILGYQRLQRESRISHLKHSIPELEDDDSVRSVRILQRHSFSRVPRLTDHKAA